MNEEVGISAKADGIGWVVTAAKDGSYITFKAGDKVRENLTNPLKTVGGITVGEMNQKHLHTRLQEFIDHHIK